MKNHGSAGVSGCGLLFAYMDFKKEVMTRDLIEKALQMGKTVAVPRVEDDDMVYYEIKDFSTLKSGYFGIMEPDGGKVCTREEGFLLVPVWPLIRRATE